MIENTILADIVAALGLLAAWIVWRVLTDR